MRILLRSMAVLGLKMAIKAKLIAKYLKYGQMVKANND